MESVLVAEPENPSNPGNPSNPLVTHPGVGPARVTGTRNCSFPGLLEVTLVTHFSHFAHPCSLPAEQEKRFIFFVHGALECSCHDKQGRVCATTSQTKVEG